MARETFISQTQPEKPHEQHRRERLALEELVKKTDRSFLRQRREGLLNTKEEFERERADFLAMVDFDEMHAIFEQLAGKSEGVSPLKMNFVYPERILVIPQDVSNYREIIIGDYSSSDNIIRLTSRLPVRWDEESSAYTRSHEEINRINSLTLKGNEVAGTKELAMLRTLVHEETHAVGHNSCVGLDDDNFSESDFSSKSGYDHRYDIYDKGGIFFRAVNEGVTEKICLQVLREYLKRQPWPQHEAVDTFKKCLDLRYDEEQEDVANLAEVGIVDELVALIANDQEIPKETAWQAIMEGYFSGRPFYESESFKQLLKKSFGEDFTSHTLPRVAELTNKGREPSAEEVLKMMRDARSARKQPKLQGDA